MLVLFAGFAARELLLEHAPSTIAVTSTMQTSTIQRRDAVMNPPQGFPTVRGG
jgi:hypothetical protein